MRRIKEGVLSLVLICAVACATAQQDTRPLIKVIDTLNDRVGYRDFSGTIRVPVMLDPFITRADTFYNIISAADSVGKPYYLLRDGRKLYHGDVWMSDYTTDCEREGFIRYRDHFSNDVGFLGVDGRPAITARFNDAGSFHNGVTTALRNASLACADSVELKDCEHTIWVGGEQILIDRKGEVLIDNFDAGDRSPDWYSMRVNATVIDTSLEFTLQGRDHLTYTFVDKKKEFIRWFNETFLPLVAKPFDPKAPWLFPDILYWSGDGWVTLPSAQYFARFRDALAPSRFQDNSRSIDIYADETYIVLDRGIGAAFMDPCGDYDPERFPVYIVSIAPIAYRTDTRYRDEFGFVRTIDGYKLFHVSLRKEENQ